MGEQDTLLTMLGEVRGDIKVLLAHHTNLSDRVNTFEKSTNERLKAHSEQISGIKTWQVRVAGGFAIVIGMVTLFKTEFMHFLGTLS